MVTEPVRERGAVHAVSGEALKQGDERLAADCISGEAAARIVTFG